MARGVGLEVGSAVDDKGVVRGPSLAAECAAELIGDDLGDDPLDLVDMLLAKSVVLEVPITLRVWQGCAWVGAEEEDALNVVVVHAVGVDEAPPHGCGPVVIHSRALVGHDKRGCWKVLAGVDHFEEDGREVRVVSPWGVELELIEVECFAKEVAWLELRAVLEVAWSTGEHMHGVRCAMRGRSTGGGAAVQLGMVGKRQRKVVLHSPAPKAM